MMLQQGSSDNLTNSTAPSGVVLVAFGKPQYYWAAYNLAYSIKRFNAALQIALISDSKDRALYHCRDLEAVIDVYVELPEQHINTNKKLDPGKAKVLLFDYLPFHYNLYLDVDAVCLKDLQPLIDQLIANDAKYATRVVGEHTIDKGRDFKEMQWAWADSLWQHFGLTKADKIYAINSSIQFIEKCPEAEAIFRTAADLYLNNPLPLAKLRMKWGGGQPDELYFNVSFGKNKFKPYEIDVVCFQMNREFTYAQIEERFYLMSYYGGKGFTPTFYIEWLDRKLKAWMQQEGLQHKYFIHRITDHKHADPKR
jgi:hypothetical protein